MGGRQKGQPNKVTTDLREFFRLFLERNSERLQELFERTSVNNPSVAMNFILDMAEFTIPKLQRTELTGSTEEDSKPIELIIKKTE